MPRLRRRLTAWSAYDAVRSAAVGDHLFAARRGARELVDLVERHGDGAVDVLRLVLFARPHVDEDDASFLEAAQELLPADRRELVASVEIVARDLVELGQLRLAGGAQRPPQRVHRRRRDAIEDALRRATALDETSRVQHLEVLRRVGDRQLRFAGQILDGALALLEEVQQLQAYGTGQRLAQAGELFVDALFQLV